MRELKIAICEDNREDEQFLRITLENILEARGLSYSLISFTSGEQMLAALEKEDFDLSFIDIYLGEVNGVTVARKVREKNKYATIIFTTSSKEFMSEGYSVGAAHYLVKPFQAKQIMDGLDRGLQVMNEDNSYSEFVINRRKEIIFHRDIKYVESQRRCCVLHTITGEKALYGKLSEIEESIKDARFLRCHRSYLVNMDNVMDLTKEDFHLYSGERIPINRKTTGAIKEAYMKYRIRKVRGDGFKWIER